MLAWEILLSRLCGVIAHTDHVEQIDHFRVVLVLFLFSSKLHGIDVAVARSASATAYTRYPAARRIAHPPQHAGPWLLKSRIVRREVRVVLIRSLRAVRCQMRCKVVVYSGAPVPAAGLALALRNTRHLVHGGHAGQPVPSIGLREPRRPLRLRAAPPSARRRVLGDIRESASGSRTTSRDVAGGAIARRHGGYRLRRGRPSYPDAGTAQRLARAHDGATGQASRRAVGSPGRGRGRRRRRVVVVRRSRSYPAKHVCGAALVFELTWLESSTRLGPVFVVERQDSAGGSANGCGC